MTVATGPAGMVDTREEWEVGPNASVEGRLVYAIGDVHGCYDILARLLATIADDVATRGQGRRPLLIFVGDYVDRGPASAKVLSSLVWLQRNAPFEPRFLKGNHEEMLLAWLDDPAEARGWLRVGGAETLRSYAVDPPAEADAIDDHLRARDDLLERMPASHLRFLQALELTLTLGDYAFVHAGVRPGVPLRKQAAADLLWIREPFLGHAKRFEKVIVHGHTWDSAEPTIREQRIGIDTGVYRTGVLTALRLEDGRIACLQAKGAGDPLAIRL